MSQSAIVQDIEKTGTSVELLDLIRNRRVSTVFQPIVSVIANDIIGYEALSRGPSDSSLYSPAMLFRVAKESGLLSELEDACIESATRMFNEQRLHGRLFVNITPEALNDDDSFTERLEKIIATSGMPSENIVLEVNERYSQEREDSISDTINKLKKLGFGVALDDLGSGLSRFDRWASLRSDYVKINKCFVQGISKDPVKQALVRSIVDISASRGASVIAEGVETSEEAETLLGLHVSLMQGFLICRPAAFPVIDSASFRGISENRKMVDKVQVIAIEAPTASCDTALSVLKKRFVDEPNLPAIVITENGKPVGVVQKRSLSSALKKKSWKGKFSFGTTEEIMNKHFICIEGTSSIKSAAAAVVADKNRVIGDVFVIVNKGMFVGVGDIMGLLSKFVDSHN